MNCDDARILVHAYLDGELDLTKSLELEGHMEECVACAQEYRGLQALERGIGDGSLYYRVPAGLRKRVQAAVRRESQAAAPRHLPPWSVPGLVAALTIVAVIAWSLAGNLAISPRNNLVAQEVLSSSMRSLIAGPLMDVESSDQHTVKPWFAGKLDFSPTVPDLASQGFPLAGGRLDYVNNRPVAALVYRHGQHVINLYSWPSVSGTEPLKKYNVQGYNIFSWTQGGMTYWAVSDMDAGELRQFVQLIQDSVPGRGVS